MPKHLLLITTPAEILPLFCSEHKIVQSLVHSHSRLWEIPLTSQWLHYYRI